MNRLDTLLGRVEVQVRALATAAAQAQLGMVQGKRNHFNFSEEFDSLAANLAEPALDDLERLRAALGCPRVAKEEVGEALD